MKTDIVFIQPIFCASRKLFDLNRKSLLSVLNYLTKNPYNIDIIFGGWCVDDEYWSEIEKIVHQFEELDR